MCGVVQTRLLPILVWTVLLPFAATILTLMLSTVIPEQRRPLVQRAIRCYFPHQSEMLPPKIIVRMEGQYWAWPWSSVPVQYDSMLLHFGYPAQADLHVDLITGACWDSRSSGQGKQQVAHGFDEDALLDWFASAGLKVDSELARQVATDILVAIEETPQSAGKNITSSPDPRAGVDRIVAHSGTPSVRTSSALETRWGFIGVLVFWCVVWLWGMRLISRRQRRRALAVLAHPTGEA